MTGITSTTEILDEPTGLTFVVNSGISTLKIVVGDRKRSEELIELPVTEYRLKIPETSRDEFEVRTKIKIPPDGIVYLTRDIPDTMGYNLGAAFRGLESQGYTLSDDTKLQARKAARQGMESATAATAEASAPASTPQPL